MNGYETYLESLLELREKEIDMYKKFVEDELRCRIQEETIRETEFIKDGEERVYFKVITIPESKYILKVN